MAKFHFYLKNPNATGVSQIFLSVHSNGKRLRYYPEKLSIEPRHWKTKTQKAGGITNAPEFNVHLADIKANAERLTIDLKNGLGYEPRPEQIISALKDFYSPADRDKEQPKDLLTFFAHVAEQIPFRINPKTNKPLSKVTARIYKQTLRVLQDFKKAKRVKVDFDTIDLDFYIDFKTFMEQELRFSANTVGKHIKQLKTVLHEATQLGLNTNLKFQGPRFRGISEPVNNIYLNESELKDLQELDLSGNQRLAQVRDVFLLGCWTGQRWSDFTRLNNAKITTDSEGHKYFNTVSKKTGQTVIIPVLPQIIPILDLYGGIDNLQLPKVISNQKMNDYLKEIAQKVNSLNVVFNKERTKAGTKVSIQKMKWECISTHAARRSFATNMFERGSIPVSLIMAITGHQTEQQFYKYIQMKPKDKATMFRQMFFESSPLRVAK